jgi:hypothetical protein
MGATARATEVDSAIEALDFETEPPPKWLQRDSKGLAPTGAVCRMLNATRLYVYFRGYSTSRRD